MLWSDRIADRLSDDVIAQNEDLKLMSGEQIEFLLTVIIFAERALDFKMITGAGQLQTVIAPLRNVWD